MLRFVVVLLLLANGLYFAWTRDWLAPLGLVPMSQSEPAHVANQIKPHAMRLLNTQEARRIEQTVTVATPTATIATTGSPTECLQSAMLDDKAVEAVLAVVQTLPASSWKLESSSQPARWIVYMGKYPNADNLSKKKAELRQLGISFEPLQSNKLEPGIALGGYETQAEANDALAQVTKRGVRTARVLEEVPGTQGQVLRLAAVDDVLRGQLTALRTALGAATLRACKS